MLLRGVALNGELVISHVAWRVPKSYQVEKLGTKLLARNLQLLTSNAQMFVALCLTFCLMRSSKLTGKVASRELSICSD